MTDKFSNLYTSAQMCAAAGIDQATLKNWISRKPSVVLLSDEERRQAGESKRFSFSYLRVVQVAITADLVRLGIQPRQAALWASSFTEMEHEWPDDLGGTGQNEHKVGELYPDGITVLVCRGELAEVSRLDPNEAWGFLAVNRLYAAPAVLLPLNPIVGRVRVALGLN